MKKLMTLLICALCSIGAAIAQNSKTYTGFVVDKNGNPVVGAEVMAPDGGASAITDSDGSFQIEVPFMLNKLTASYAGMRDNTRKLGDSSNLVFKMKQLRKMTGFISFIGNFGVQLYKGNEEVDGRIPENYSSTYVSYGLGLMGGQIGQLGKWGWYAKWIGYVDGDFEGSWCLTAGAIRKLSSAAHLYFGGGLAEHYDTFGFALDLGVLFTVSQHVNIIAGLNYSNSSNKDEGYRYISAQDYTYYTKHKDINHINLNIGVGYVF
ncbi:MAG: carboxypeptidase regulatory-like domain-containing protein [Bacteroides sp.]|nr:carboxypeptidase regulatory-like domain-containing protein [Bacteroides sp.]